MTTAKKLIDSVVKGKSAKLVLEAPQGDLTINKLSSMDKEQRDDLTQAWAKIYKTQVPLVFFDTEDSEEEYYEYVYTNSKKTKSDAQFEGRNFKGINVIALADNGYTGIFFPASDVKTMKGYLDKVPLDTGSSAASAHVEPEPDLGAELMELHEKYHKAMVQAGYFSSIFKGDNKGRPQVAKDAALLDKLLDSNRVIITRMFRGMEGYKHK